MNKKYVLALAALILSLEASLLADAGNPACCEKERVCRTRNVAPCCQKEKKPCVRRPTCAPRCRRPRCARPCRQPRCKTSCARNECGRRVGQAAPVVYENDTMDMDEEA